MLPEAMCASVCQIKAVDGWQEFHCLLRYRHLCLVQIAGEAPNKRDPTSLFKKRDPVAGTDKPAVAGTDSVRFKNDSNPQVR